jgi:prepilin-type N-terminal cleavage/methylation domain-containing protein
MTSRQSGFTLIEMIVSLGVFSFVITIAVGALLMLVAASKQLQGEQVVMTNLSFALDSMTREIRTGTYYYCDSQASTGGAGNIFNPNNDVDALLTGDATKDCPNGPTGSYQVTGVAFKEGGDSITGANDRILYYFDKSAGKLYRRVGAGAPQSVVSSDIYIKDARFTVTGSKKLSLGGSGNQDQPAVTIFIEAAESNSVTAKSYYLETTVTQRTLDI